MPTKFSPQQTISREQLNQLVNATDKDLADILGSIDSELSRPLYLRESSPADLVVSVGPISITNPETGRQRSATPIDGVVPTFAGGTITFSYGGGNLTATPSAGTALVVALGADNWIKVGVSLDSSGDLSLTAGTQGASEAAAGDPASPVSTQLIGYISVQTISSALQNIPAGQVYQYVGTASVSTPVASATESGIVNVTNQTFAGKKHFLDEVGFGPAGTSTGFAATFSNTGDILSVVQVTGDTSASFARSEFRASATAGALIIVGATSGAYSGSGAFTTPNTGYVFTPVGDLNVGATTSKGIKFWTNNALAAELTSSGNFGVGLGGTPDERFHAEGGTNVKVKLETTSTGNANEGGVDLYNEGSYRGGLRYYESLSGTEGVAISSGAAVRMLVDASGRVGIGTTSPDEVLHVYDSAGHSMSSDNPGAAARVELSASAGSGDYPVLDLLLDSNGAVNRNAGLRFSMRNSAGNRTHSAIIAAKNLNVTNGAETSALEFYTRSAGSVPLSAMYIDEDQNVGIGTTSPASIFGASSLHIGEGNSSIVLGDNTASGEGASPIIAFRNYRAGLGGAADMSIGFRAEPRYLRIGAGTSLTSTSGMVVEHTGNVGIGTIGPAAKLAVKYVSDGGLSITTGDITPSAGVAALINASGNTSSEHILQLGSLNAGIRATFRADGNVGIGTTSPTELLEVRTGKFRASNSTNAVGVEIFSDSSNSYIDASATEYFRTNGTTNAMVINSSQNVGIGTTSPGGILEVASGNYLFGDSWVDGFGRVDGRVALVHDGQPYLYVYDSSTIGAGKGGAIRLASQAVAGSNHTFSEIQGGKVNSTSGNFASFLEFKTNNSGGTLNTVMYINEGQNVGIGTTSPNVALDVIGSIEYTGTITDVSDERYKQNITSLTNGLVLINQLSGRRFDWRNEEFPEKKFKQGADVGFIAQEVEAVFPELVKTSADGFKSMEYNKLIAPMVEAIKELTARLEVLEGN